MAISPEQAAVVRNMHPDTFWSTLTNDQQIWFALSRSVDARIGYPFWQQPQACKVAICDEIMANISKVNGV